MLKHMMEEAAKDYAAGAEAERAKIAAYLRTQAPHAFGTPTDMGAYVISLADTIERGDHSPAPGL